MHGSIIIPAHNEERLLPGCLKALADQPGIEGFEVIVVVNGSTDRSAEVARAASDLIPGLVVVETPTGGKANALNLGDSHATLFPRIYLDADIQLSPGTVRSLWEALNVDEPRAAAPHIRFDTEGTDAVVRGFYAIYERLPYVTEGLIGLGIYALSEKGRQRFDAFPELTADDLFVQRLFPLDERITVPGEFVVRVPRRWQDLLAVRTRAAQGSQELAAAPPVPGMDAAMTTRSTAQALVELLRRRPGLIPAAAVYSGITVAARVRSRRTPQQWHRDESSRQQS